MKNSISIILISLILVIPVEASHLMGGEITWECIKQGPNQGMYIFKMKLYRDCNGIPGPGSATLMVHNHPLVNSIFLNLVSQIDISPDCDPINSGNTQMSCASPQQGSVEEFLFESSPINLFGVPPPTGWHFTWDGCCRNGAITNIAGASGLGFTLRAVMYPYSIGGVPQNTAPCFDSSPVFNEQPKTIICIGYPFSYSHIASDPELDSLIYSWADPLDWGGYNPASPNILSFAAPYSTNSPIPGNPSLNPATGEVSYFSTTSGNFVTCIKVSAFKCGQLVAEVYREIQVVLLNCPNLASGNPNTPPVVQPPFAGGTSYFLQVTAGALVNFNIGGNDNNIYSGGVAQNLTIEVSGGQFSSNYIDPTLCLNPPCATFDNGAGVPPPFSAPTVVAGFFNWQTDCNHVVSGCGTNSSLYTFAVKIFDDFCPAPAMAFATVTIEVLACPPCMVAPVANLPDTIEICDTILILTANSYHSYLWSTGETTQSITVNQTGDYWVQVCTSELGEVLVYENDFDSFIGSEWSDNTTSTYNSTTVLGNFNNASTTLNLSNLPTHNSIKAVFDLYLLDSWDGNAGPDIWDLSIDGVSTINTTFSNINFGGGIQSYPGNYPSSNAPLSGASQIGLSNICYNGINSISSLYKIDSPFSTHSASSASIDFSASGLESSCNESWAIDSVKIYVDSALSCCAIEFVHVEFTVPNANLGPDIITCDSTWTITANNGYTYLWSTGDTTQSIIVDTTGTYQVMICDTTQSQICCSTEEIDIQIKCPPTTAIINSPTCNADADGSISLTFIDGTLPQTVVWQNSNNAFISNMPNITNLIAGEYIVSTTCGINCPPVIDTFIVPEPPVLVVPGIKDDISCFGEDDGSIDIDISTLVVPVLSTDWTGPDSFSSTLEDINNLPPGMYSVLVTDVNNCFITKDFEIKEPDSILPNPLITNVKCNGGNDGSASLSITGGTTPYGVIWSTANLLNLYAGTYTYTLTDSNNCVFVGDVIISEPNLITPNPITTPVICYGESNGTAIVSPTGGTPPYNISWGANNPSLLPAGPHVYTIVDSNNCSITNSVIITQPNPLSAIPYTQDVSCYGFSDGLCTLSVIGGTTPYNVSWNGADPTLLSAGTYGYSIVDFNSCQLSDSITIYQPDSIKVSYTTTHVQCYGEPTGTIDVNVLYVNPPYFFNWSNPNDPTFFSTTQNINNLYAGTYLLIVTDADNCEVELQIIVNQPTAISQELDIQTSNYTGYDIACKGDNSGWISVKINGGYVPFSYLWSTGATTDSIFDLFAGIYTLIITDGLGCSETVQYLLVEPATNLTGAIQATTNYNGFNISCFNGDDGGIREIPIGGVSPYAWYWDGMSGGEYLINQIAGYHRVELYDNNNCFWEDNITLTEPPPLDIQKISVTDTCGREVGEAYATVSGGVQDYQYIWSSGDTLNVATNLSEGTHEFVITDANNCTDTAWYNIGNLPSPLIDFYTFPEHKRFFEQLDDPFVFIDNTQGFWQNVEYWYWDFGDNNFGIDSIAFHFYHDTGMYDVSLIIVTEYNCVDTITKSVLVDDYNIYIPNAFTPDDYDEMNNIFYVYGYGVRRLLMNIYSRWGALLFESDNMKKGWDGRKQGESEICPSGTYVYYIEIENIYGEIFKFEGQVLLIR